MRVAIVLALFLAGLGAAAQFGKMSLSLAALQAAYPGTGPVALGFIVSLVGIVGLVFGTTGGLLVARIGPRRAVTGALALGAAVSAVQALGLPYALLLASRVAEGVSHLAIVVVGPTVIAAAAVGRWQGAAMSLWSSFFGLTFAGLALLAPVLIEAKGLAGLFLAHAGWMAVMAVVLRLLLPPDPVARVERRGGLLAEHLAIYRSPFVAAPALGFVFYTGLYLAVLTLVPGLLPGRWAGVAATAMPLVSIVVSLVSGVTLLPWLGAVRTVQAGFALGLLAALGFLAVLGNGPAMALAAVALAGGLGLVQGASFAAIPALNPEPADRARAAGAIAQLGNVGSTAGTPLLAALLAGLGPAGVAVFALPMCLAGIAVHAWLAARRARRG